MLAKEKSRQKKWSVYFLSFQPVAKKMGLDTKSNASLWKDLACIEMNVAVLYSFQVIGSASTTYIIQ